MRTILKLLGLTKEADKLKEELKEVKTKLKKTRTALENLNAELRAIYKESDAQPKSDNVNKQYPEDLKPEEVYDQAVNSIKKIYKQKIGKIIDSIKKEFET